MTSAQELVAVFDDDGRPRPGAPRGRVREEGLWHACATILVRSLDGRRVCVHRRTDTKDVYPGLYDCWAGGVLAHVYGTRTDGPFAHQPEEVAEGWWMDLDDLRTRIDDPDWPVVPDGRALFRQWLTKQED